MTVPETIDIDLRRTGNGGPYIAEGWAQPETHGTWCVNGRGRLVVPLSSSGPAALRSIRIVALAFTNAGKIPSQRLSVRVDGNEILSRDQVSGWIDTKNISFDPPRTIGENRSLEIEFCCPDATSPASLGVSADQRVLGFLLQHVTLEVETSAKAHLPAESPPEPLARPAVMSGPRHFLTACTTVKNEAQYIYEWLSFNHSIGVEKFFIYNNGSTDDTIEVIRGWPMAHRVQIIDWPFVAGQVDAYCHMLENFRETGEWCAFIDADEFICPQTDMCFPDILQKFSSRCTGFYLHWLVFGSSGFEKRQPGLVTETFIRRGMSGFGPNAIGKTVVKLDQAIAPRGVHVIQSRGRLVNDNDEDIDQGDVGYHPNSSHRLVALNHYFTKSHEEWVARRSLGRATQSPNSTQFRRTEEDFKRHDVNNVVDTRAADLMRHFKPRYYPV